MAVCAIVQMEVGVIHSILWAVAVEALILGALFVAEKGRTG